MKRKFVGILTAAAMLLPCVPQLSTTASAAGEITTISSASDLQALATEVNNGTSYAGKKIRLTTDITLSGNTWTPIGNSTNKFEGTFDGQGHSISNLSVNASDADYQGLFGYVCGGTVKNLTVNGSVSVSGTGTGVGGIVGYLDAATVSSCKSSVTVAATNSSAVGGIVGYNATGIITDCYSTGPVSGNYNVGGITGWNFNGTVSNCHRYSGNLTIKTGNSRGHIVGENDGSVTHCYYLSSLTGDGIGDVSSYGYNDAASLSADAFRNQYSFTEWDFTDTWTMGSSYPELHYNPYAGFSNHIQTVEQLEMLRDAVNNNVTDVEIYDTYYLDNDLDLSGIEWTPIGTFYDTFSDTFTGWNPSTNRETSRTITGLTITGASSYRDGLFGIIGNEGVVKNITFSYCNIAGDDTIGCVAGENNGTIQNITVAGGTLTGSGNWIGGVAGKNGGTINNVTVTGTTVSGAGYIGGIAGTNPGGSTIQNVIVSGAASVSGSGDQIGGVTGYSFNTVENVTIIGITVTGASDVGGVVGRGNTPIGTCSVSSTGVTGTQNTGGVTGYSYNRFNGSGFSASDLTVSGGEYTGGVFGYATGEVTNVTLSGATVSGSVSVGGIAGYSYKSISGCTNNASVTGTGNNVGGITGYADESVSGCTNTAAVSGEGNNVGGIVGYQQRNYMISNCVNSGTISGTNRSGTDGSDSIGGIVGYLEAGTVTGCRATSSSVVKGHVNLGGIAGKNEATVRLSYNEGAVGDNIRDVINVGGVVGSNNVSGAVLENSYNTGSVTGEVIGGVIGISVGTVRNCYSKGSLTADYQKGGVIGNNDGGNVESCYFLKGTAYEVCHHKNGVIDGYSRELTATEFLDETNFKNWDFNDTSIWTLSSSAGAPIFFDLKLVCSGDQETGYYQDTNGNYYEDATAFVINLDCGEVSTRPYIKGTITSEDKTKEFEGRLRTNISEGEVIIGLVVTGLADAEAELSAMAVIE